MPRRRGGRRLRPKTPPATAQPGRGRWVLRPDPDLVLRPGRLEPAPGPKGEQGGEGEPAGEEPSQNADPEPDGLNSRARAALADVLDRTLIRQAFTHASYANEKPDRTEGDNERLEFLGDAVLGTCISEYLVRRHPGWSEGELTRIRASIVCEPTLARRAATLGLGNCLRLGKGEASGGGRDKPSILAATFEALVGAIYLEAGLERAARFILDELVPEVQAAVRGDLAFDNKTRLQQVAQHKGRPLEYRVVGESGPDHQPEFTVSVLVGGQDMGEGRGGSKKEAEQAAAAAALERMGKSGRPVASQS